MKTERSNGFHVIPQPPALYVAAVVLLAGVYFVTGKLGLSLAFLNASASAFWPPTGIALATLILFGRRFWPGVFIGAFLVNFTTQGSLWTTLAIACGNTLEAWVGAWLVMRFASGAKAFDKLHTMLSFVGLAGVVSASISATIGVTSLTLAGFNSKPFFSVWLTWWLGDFVSAFLVAPFFIVWLNKPISLPRPVRFVEALGVCAAVLAIVGFVFFGWFPDEDKNMPLGYLALLPLLWAAFRFGVRGATATALATSLLVLVGTLHGYGPYFKADKNASMLFVQAFIGTMTITALTVAATMSERRRAEEALLRNEAELEKLVEQRTARLQQSVAELEAFSYSLSHDMRAPLRAINMFTQCFVEDYGDKCDQTGLDYLKKVRSSSERLDRLIQDVLTLSGTANHQIQLQPVDTDKLIHQIISERPEFQPPHACVAVQSPIHSVRGHEASLTQCVTNLLSNGVKFVPSGTKPRISIRSEAQNGHIRLWFEDNGIGIDGTSKDRLFKIFERVHGEARFPGNGMGLAIVRKAAERMGGTVGVESEVGKGSRFWVQLPAATSEYQI